MSTLFLLENYNVENLAIKVHKLSGGKGEVVYINHQGSYVTMQLSPEFLVAPFGASAGPGQREDTVARLSLDIRTTSEIEDKIYAIEKKLRQLVKDEDVYKNLEDLDFVSCVKKSKDAKYSNTVRTKINVDDVSVCLEGSKKTLKAHEIKSRANVKVIFQLKSLWRKGNTYGPTLEVKSVLINNQQETYTFY